MTLVEVMMGLLVVTLTALAALSALMFSWRLADANLRSITAMAAAKSVAEQLIALPYDQLFESSLNVDVPSSTVGSLNTRAWNDRTDDIHNTPTKTSDDLVMSINPEVTHVQDEASGVDFAQIVISYRWEQSSFFATRTRADYLTMVISKVSSF